TVTLVSGTATASGADPTVSGDANSYTPVISADGSFVVFVSVASNLFPPFALNFSAINRSNVYLFDNRPGATHGDLAILSDHDSTGTTGDGDSGNPSISDDGRYVAFESRSTNLISGTTVTPLNNIYLVDTQTQQATLVSHAAGLPTTEANGPSFDPV